MMSFNRAIMLGLTLFAVASVLFLVPPESVFRPRADEGTYLFYASSVNEHGFGMIREVGRLYVSMEKARLRPTPLRVGHTLATALWLRIFPATFVSLAWFSFLCFILFLLVSFYYCQKHFGSDIAFPFLMMLASSPLMMAMGRRALSDMHGNLWCGLVVWLLLDFLRDRKKLTYVLLIGAYSMAILVRESSLALWPFLVAAFMVSRFAYKNELPWAYLAGLILVPAAVVGSVYLVAFGGMSEAGSMVLAVFKLHGTGAAHTSDYARLYCAGPWFRYVVDFCLLSPLTLLLFVGYAGHRLIQRNFGWRDIYFCLYFFMIFGVFSSLKYSKAVRFVINLDMVIVLFATRFLWEVFRQKETERRMPWVLIAAVAIFFVNYLSFLNIFCLKDVYDPVSYELLSAQSMIP